MGSVAAAAAADSLEMAVVALEAALVAMEGGRDPHSRTLMATSACHRTYVLACDSDDEPDKKKGKPNSLSLSDLLDKPVIVPGLPPRADESALMRKFKEMVENDYQMAEAIYAGGVFAVLIFFSQQAVRVYKHCYFLPDKQCPWDASSAIDHFWF